MSIFPHFVSIILIQTFLYRNLSRDQAGREIIRYIKIAGISFVNKKPCGFKERPWKVTAKRLKFHCFIGEKKLLCYPKARQSRSIPYFYPLESVKYNFCKVSSKN